MKGYVCDDPTAAASSASCANQNIVDIVSMTDYVLAEKLVNRLDSWVN